MLPKLLTTSLLAALAAAANIPASSSPAASPTASPSPLLEGPSASANASAQPSTSSAVSPTTGIHVKAPEFVWGKTVMRGVNAGGWLVLEPWITPSLFDNKPDWVVDECTYGQYARGLGQRRMEQITAHWDTWLTITDFASMSAVGLNVVRIPIGYWSLIPLNDDETYLVGAFEYLKRAVKWAAQFDLKVVIDLHGFPGVDKGKDGGREWILNTSHQNRSIEALEVLTTEFVKEEYEHAVTAIIVAHQPLPLSREERQKLSEYTYNAYGNIRNISSGGDSITVMFSDAGLGVLHWNGFMPYPDYENVALDYHVYTNYEKSLVSMSWDETLRWHCNVRGDLKHSNDNLWTIAGGFSIANTDCARWLHGRGVGARYDDSLKKRNSNSAKSGNGKCAFYTGDPKDWSPEYKEHLARSFETQTWVYEEASGWIYTTWKTESAADWSFESGLKNGWIPTPITAKPHGLPCRYTCSASASGAGVRSSSVNATVVMVFFFLALLW